jgi:V/A-type H+-transporting ATPase subunit I
MNLEMSYLEIICIKRDLQITVSTLQQLGRVQIDDIREAKVPSIRPMMVDPEILHTQDELNLLATQLDGILDELGVEQTVPSISITDDFIPDAKSGISELTPQLQELMNRKDDLQDELDSLPLHEATLRKLKPIIPSTASDPGNMSLGVLADKSHSELLGSIRRKILDLSNQQAKVVTSDVDDVTLAMLIVYPEHLYDEIEELLKQEDITRLRLPPEFGEGPSDDALIAMSRRLSAIPKEIDAIDQEIALLAGKWQDKLIAWRAAVLDKYDAYNVLSHFGETDLTNVILGWVPTQDVEKVRNALEERIGNAVLVNQLPVTHDMEKRAPTALKNPPPARPFETLINLLSIPRYGHIDPTGLMALFLPIFFGMMLGDAGYGVILLGLCLFMLRKFKDGDASNLIKILAFGSIWSIVFGILYGEVFGTLGEHFGMHAIWIERASAEHVTSLFMMTMSVGAIHITLGLILGVYEAAREKSRGHLLERGGMLLGLIGLFILVGVLADLLPQGLMTPAISGLIVGIVLISSNYGFMGVILGPVEFLGVIGNMLSYLRIAAIGLASVYLAEVANDMAGLLGNIIVGAIVAILIHALNIVLGAFSPTIHSMRLHFVEFFRKFYEGGGRAYEPFQSHAALKE